MFLSFKSYELNKIVCPLINPKIFFRNYAKVKMLHLNKKVLDDYWLTGFFEGDGCLTSYTNPKGIVDFSFVLTQKNPQILYKIQKYLGTGSIHTSKEGFSYLRVRSKEGLFKVALLLNGKLILEKRIEQYADWVHRLNQKYGTSLVPITEPASLSWNHAWLTGFGDAEGSFHILLTTRFDKRQDKSQQSIRLRVRFYLDQGKSLGDIKKLRSWLGGTLFEKMKGHPGHVRLMVDTFKGATPLVDYFSRFPPLTTKFFVRFIRYARVYGWHQQGEWKERLPEIRHLIKLNKRLSTSRKA